jgi:hypothetical protein
VTATLSLGPPFSVGRRYTRRPGHGPDQLLLHSDAAAAVLLLRHEAAFQRLLTPATTRSGTAIFHALHTVNPHPAEGERPVPGGFR